MRLNFLTSFVTCQKDSFYLTEICNNLLNFLNVFDVIMLYVFYVFLLLCVTAAIILLYFLVSLYLLVSRPITKTISAYMSLMCLVHCVIAHLIDIMLFERIK